MTTRTGMRTGTRTKRTTRAEKPNGRKFSNKIHKHESAIIYIYWLKDTVGEPLQSVRVTMWCVASPLPPFLASCLSLLSLLSLCCRCWPHKTTQSPTEPTKKTKQLLIIFNEIPNKHVKANECHFKKVKACGMRCAGECVCVCVFVCMCAGVKRGTNVLQKQQGEPASTMWDTCRMNNSGSSKINSNNNKQLPLGSSGSNSNSDSAN